MSSGLIGAKSRTRSDRENRTILELNCDSFVRTFHKEPSRWLAVLRGTSLEIGAQLGDLSLQESKV